MLSDVFGDLFTRQRIQQHNFEHLFKRVYSLMLHKYGLDVYEAIRAALQRNGRNAESKEAFMPNSGMVRDICMHLDRTYVVTRKLRRIDELATQNCLRICNRVAG